MSRVALAKIPSLTLYKDEFTLSRRGPPIPQLTCIGKPCRLYQPEVVRCVNVGGSGTDVDWKCEADLPDSLRFGKVEVSCEGWDGPGDPYVLKGSCGLEYRLVQVPTSLRGPGAEDPRYPSRVSRWLHGKSSRENTSVRPSDPALLPADISQDPAAAFFMLLWVVVLGLIIYSMISSCLRRTPGGTTPHTPRRPWWNHGPGSGWFSGSRPDAPDPGPNDPPPPYSKHPPSSSTAGAARAEGWRPGFWTGAALGGLGAYLLNRPRPRDDPWFQPRVVPVPARSVYDWEADRMFRPAPASSSWFGGSAAGTRRRSGWDDHDRGEGPSNLGTTRRSTGFGSSRVR
ncbi:hypothetical protein BN946_scf184724.g6 [Trametes cinnabarina]|uniref:Store-operated calcium entry-associated regulatory factor n=1 Tax=Pycnoporus cinnabarinus TaxID=5643 RepID=A0A060SU13_PYCCI|nr:hypothetical protein BN946_scf184724.g6 [Trametes cinnabarina]